MTETTSPKRDPIELDGAIAPALRQVPGWFLGLCIAVLLINRFGYHFFANPLPDEAYYWLWGQRPALSYFDHAPLQAWMQGAFTWVFGPGLFALRLPTVVTSLVTIACLIWWAKRYSNTLSRRDLSALVAAAFCSPLFFIYLGMAFNDHLMVAFLSVASILVFTTLNEIATVGRVNVRALYGAGLTIGLAGLTKYNAGLFAIAVFACVLWFPKFRPFLKSAHLYLAALLCLACLSPVIWWNLTNGAPSLQYNLNDRLGDGVSVPKIVGRLGTFILTFSLMFSPVLMISFISHFWRKPTVTWVQNWRQMVLALFAIPTLIWGVMTYFTYVLFYWNIIAVVAALPFALLHIRRKWALMLHMSLGLVMISAATFNFTVLPISALFGPADSESSLMFGWSDIARDTTELAASNSVDFVAASDYRHAAILAFHTDDIQTEVIAKRISQFSLWFDQDARSGQDAIILTTELFPINDVISDRFLSVELLKTHRVRRFGHDLETYRFYLAKDYQEPK